MRKVLTKKDFINAKLYKKIVGLMPIPCVDIIIKYKNSFLLGKRNNNPVKGGWWFPGGRILKGESISRAVVRKIKEETGLSVKNIKFLTTQDYFLKDSVFGPSTHSVALIFTANTNSKENLNLDKQHSKFEWFSKINKRWPKYVRSILVFAGYKY